VFYFSGFYDRVMRWRVDAAFDPDAVSDEISKMRQDGGNANQNLSFIPEGIKLYSWNSFFGVDFYRTQLHQGMKLGSGAGLPSPDEELLKDRMDAVMALLRDEIGWYFFGVDLTGAIPLPQGVLFIGINDSEQARTLIQDFFEEDGSWRFKTERYQGREIRYVESIPFLDTLEPAFCVMNDYVLAAVNRGLIKEAVDTQEDPERSFLKQGVFKENRYAFDEKSHALFFADIHALMKDVSGILEWGNQWADVQLSRQMAFRDGLRTRLEEVEQEIIKKQEEQSLLSIRLAESLAQKEALEASLEDGEEIGKELDRKRRFLESVQRAVRSAEEEEQRLLAVQDDASRQLTEAGLKLLKDVQEDLRKKKTRENEILAEISGLEARHHQHRASMAKIEDLSAQIAQDENTAQDEEAHWTALEETRQELIETIRHYDEAGLPTSDQRQLVLNELIKPLLEALGRIESVFFQSRVLDNRIRSEVFIEVK